MKAFVHIKGSNTKNKKKIKSEIGAVKLLHSRELKSMIYFIDFGVGIRRFHTLQSRGHGATTYSEPLYLNVSESHSKALQVKNTTLP